MMLAGDPIKSETENFEYFFKVSFFSFFLAVISNTLVKDMLDSLFETLIMHEQNEVFYIANIRINVISLPR